MTNYFDFYDMPVSFGINTAELKRVFLQKSRQYHPDFHTQSDAEAQEQALNLATFNNKAYQVLSNLDQRIQYLLTLKGEMRIGERYELPASFLMQMMEVNEALMELTTEPNPEQITTLTTELQQIETDLQNTLQPLLDRYSDRIEQSEDLKKIKEFYYKKRYLLRIRESLLKFAP